MKRAPPLWSRRVRIGSVIEKGEDTIGVLVLKGDVEWGQAITIDFVKASFLLKEKFNEVSVTTTCGDVKEVLVGLFFGVVVADEGCAKVAESVLAGEGENA